MSTVQRIHRLSYIPASALVNTIGKIIGEDLGNWGAEIIREHYFR